MKVNGFNLPYGLSYSCTMCCSLLLFAVQSSVLWPQIALLCYLFLQPWLLMIWNMSCTRRQSSANRSICIYCTIGVKFILIVQAREKSGNVEQQCGVMPAMESLIWRAQPSCCAATGFRFLGRLRWMEALDRKSQRISCDSHCKRYSIIKKSVASIWKDRRKYDGFHERFCYAVYSTRLKRKTEFARAVELSDR